MLTGMFRWTATRGKNSIGEFEVDLEKLNEAQIQWLVTRGITESIRNSWASIKDDDDAKRDELSRKAGLEWCERIARGEVIEGGRGGPRLTLFQKALRRVVAAWLVDKKGMDATEAEKAARDPHGIVKHYAQIAADQSGGDVRELFERTMATFTTAAQAIVERERVEDVEV